MIRELKVRVKLSHANLNVLMGIDLVTKVIFKRVDPIPSPIKGGGTEEMGVAVTLSKPAYFRF